MRLRYALAALLLVPLADAILLVAVADAIGWEATVLLVVLTGLVGMLLVRAEGRNTLARLRRKAARGDPPTDELLDGGLLIAAGAFLLTPGVVTDAIGFLFALPVTRPVIRAALKRVVVVPYLDRKFDGFVTGGVWTSGFPGDDSDGSGSGVGVGSDPAPGPDDGPGGPSGGDGGDADTVDVDPEDYSVEGGNR